MDVARLAGVSKTTVSNVITGAGYVSEERRLRIELAIAHLEYRPNAFARGLSSRRVSTVGVVSANPADPFVARVMCGIIAEASVRDILVTVSTHGTSGGAADFRRAAGQQPGDALIYIAGEQFSRGVLAALADQHLLVLAGEADPGVGVAAVTADPRPAARQLAAQVASRGHDRVAIAEPSGRRWSVTELVAGLREGLTSAGITPDRVRTVTAEASVLGGMAVGEQLFGDQSMGSRRPTAVLCTNDEVALGVLQYCRHIGVLVPEQVSLTGFGNTPAGRAVTPSLTTAHVPAEDVGRAALEMLVGRQGEVGPGSFSARTIAATFVDGGSVGTPVGSPPDHASRVISTFTKSSDPYGPAYTPRNGGTSL